MAFPHIDTPSGGLLTAADLETARRESTGRVHAVRTAADYYEETIPVGYGYEQAAEAATELGADDYVLSMRRHYRARNLAWLAVLMLATGAAVRMAWPLLGS